MPATLSRFLGPLSRPLFVPTAGGTWTPASMSGLHTWLEADTSGNTTTVWQDGSGNGHNTSAGATNAALGSTAAAPPTIVTGGAFIYYNFAGSGQSLSLASVPAGSFSAFCVASNGAVGAYRNILNIGQFGLFYTGPGATTSGALWGVGRQAATDEAFYDFANISSGWHIHGATVNLASGTATAVYLDGTQKATLSTSSTGGVSANMISGANNGYIGGIAAIIICSGVSNSSDISSLTSYWRTKYSTP